LKGIAAVVLVAAVGIAGPQIWAPTQKAEAFPIDALSLGSNAHGAMTRTAVRQFLREVYGITTPTLAQEQAATEVGIGNEAVDADQISSAKHFDGENFTGGKAQITANLTTAVTQAKADVPGFARTSVGAALHTIQDFYAHTNWVELGKTTINPNLYNSLSVGTIAGPREVTCDFLDGGQLTTTKLTSGYYGGEDRVAEIAGKCRHGGPTDLGAGSGGMNKDFNLLLFSPHAAFHTTAADLAIKASLQFLKDYRLKVANETKTKNVFNVPV
jgi:hypothetical protein